MRRMTNKEVQRNLKRKQYQPAAARRHHQPNHHAMEQEVRFHLRAQLGRNFFYCALDLGSMFGRIEEYRILEEYRIYAG
jgi:hypothetical protein